MTQEVFAAVASSLGEVPARPAGDDVPGAGCAGSRGTSSCITHATAASRRSAGRTPRSGSSRSPRRRDEVELSESPADVTGLYQRALRLVQHQVEERTWTAFWKATVESRTPAEVAAELGITPNAVRLAKSHVLRRLRRRWAS